MGQGYPSSSTKCEGKERHERRTVKIDPAFRNVHFCSWFLCFLWWEGGMVEWRVDPSETERSTLTRSLLPFARHARHSRDCDDQACSLQYIVPRLHCWKCDIVAIPHLPKSMDFCKEGESCQSMGVLLGICCEGGKNELDGSSMGMELRILASGVCCPYRVAYCCCDVAVDSAHRSNAMAFGLLFLIIRYRNVAIVVDLGRSVRKHGRRSPTPPCCCSDACTAVCQRETWTLWRGWRCFSRSELWMKVSHTLQFASYIWTKTIRVS